jgi:putative flavoprotein involved in K+ transport
MYKDHQEGRDVEFRSEQTSGRPAQQVATSPPPAFSRDESRWGVGAPAPELDVLVIGAGQAGLAIAYQLQATGLRYAVVDIHSRVGDSWRQRYDSLVLFTPRSYSALPGLAVAGDPNGYPTKDEIADYLESYADHFALPIRLKAGIRSLDRVDGRFRAMTTGNIGIEARAVVIASGAFQVPKIPALSAGFSPEVCQLTAASYRNPSQVPAGTVLVAGDGATGRQIALELATTHKVLLATGRSRRVTPERVLGRSVFWWLDHLGVLRASRNTRIGRRMMAGDPFPGRGLALPRLRKAGVAVVPRLAAGDGKTVRFADEGVADIDALVWATGYRDHSEWVGTPAAKSPDGSFVESRGVSPVPGLYFVGRSWQWTRGSALLTGVGADAAYVTAHITRALADRHVSSERS